MLRFVWGTFRCHSNVNARVSGVGTHLASSLASATFSAYEFMPVVFPTKYEIVDSFMPHDAKGAAGTAAFPNGYCPFLLRVQIRPYSQRSSGGC